MRRKTNMGIAGQMNTANAISGAGTAYDIYNNWSQNKWSKGNQAANAKRNLLIMQAQMDWQERMDNTKHQREVKDLEKAGLNPILSVTQGATGAGGAPSGGAGAGGAATSLKSAGTAELGTIAQNITNARQQNELISAQKAKTNAETAGILSHNPYVAKSAKADIAAKQAQTLGQNLDNQFNNETYTHKLTQKFAEVESAVAKGRIDIAEAKFLGEYGMTKEEAFRLGEAGIKLIGDLVKGGAAWRTIQAVKKELLAGKNSASGYTKTPWAK